MGKKSKNGTDSSYSNVDLGKERKKRIRRFRSLDDPEGTRYRTLDDAVNTLLDRQLEAERV